MREVLSVTLDGDSLPWLIGIGLLLTWLQKIEVAWKPGAFYLGIFGNPIKVAEARKMLPGVGSDEQSREEEFKET